MIANIENDGNLGMDFLKAHQCDLVLAKQVMKVNSEEILCFANSRNAQQRCCKVAILWSAEIPPESKMIVSGYTKGVVNKSGIRLIEADTKFFTYKRFTCSKGFGLSYYQYRA